MVAGFRNLNGPEGTVAQCLESLGLDDLGDSSDAVALMVAGKSWADEALVRTADQLPDGQSLWVFSPFSRQVTHARAKVTHVPASSDREFVLKMAGHLERFVKAQPQGSPLNPSWRPFPEVNRSYGSLADYRPLVDVVHTVDLAIGGVPFQFFSDLRSDRDQLVVLGQDAMTRSAVSLPYFYRWKWATDFKGSVIILNDPTLYLDDRLNAGWWVGTPERDYVDDAAKVVASIADTLGIPHENVLFAGASAGGFSSLHMAAALRGSSAFVDIPQTNLRTYSERDEANAAVRVGLGAETVDEVPEYLLHRIDAIERFRFEGHVPRFVYAQNMRDATHVHAQMGQFKERLPGLPGYSPDLHIFEEYSQWHLAKGGHFPLKRSSMVQRINTMLD